MLTHSSCELEYNLVPKPFGMIGNAFLAKIVQSDPNQTALFELVKTKKVPLNFFWDPKMSWLGPYNNLSRSLLKYAHVLKKLKNIAITNRLISLKHFLKNINFNL